jgi:hypothetical protein
MNVKIAASTARLLSTQTMLEKATAMEADTVVL